MTSRYHLFCVVFLTFFIVSSTWYIPDTLGWCKEIISTLVVLVASKLDTINQWIVARGPRGSNHHAIHPEVPIYTAEGGVQGSDETRDIITEEETDNDDCSLLFVGINGGGEGGAAAGGGEGGGGGGGGRPEREG